MALLPYVLDKSWPWQLNLVPEDLLRDSGSLKQLARAAQDLGTSIKSDKEKFQVNVDVQHFAPEEISVKTADGQLIIEGKHEEKQDEHGYVSRQFVRRYALPEGCQEENVQSRLSSDGVLTVTAPKQQLAVKGERVVPIQHTGPVRKRVSEPIEVKK